MILVQLHFHTQISGLLQMIWLGVSKTQTSDPRKIQIPCSAVNVYADSLP